MPFFGSHLPSLFCFKMYYYLFKCFIHVYNISCSYLPPIPPLYVFLLAPYLIFMIFNSLSLWSLPLSFETVSAIGLQFAEQFRLYPENQPHGCSCLHLLDAGIANPCHQAAIWGPNSSPQAFQGLNCLPGPSIHHGFKSTFENVMLLNPCLKMLWEPDSCGAHL